MIHSTVIIHVPARYWFTLHPNWCCMSERHKRRAYQEHIYEVERDLSLPGLRVHVMLVHKSEGEYTVERVRIPWSYRLWWLLNGKKWMEADRKKREAAMEAGVAFLRTRL